MSCRYKRRISIWIKGNLPLEIPEALEVFWNCVVFAFILLSDIFLPSRLTKKELEFNNESSRVCRERELSIDSQGTFACFARGWKFSFSNISSSRSIRKICESLRVMGSLVLNILAAGNKSISMDYEMK